MRGPPLRVLHFAPERCIEGPLRARHADGYLSADLDALKAMVVIDITRIDYPDESFDAVLNEWSSRTSRSYTL
jgi:hypothetical protein